MEANTQLNERRLADAWAELHAHTTNGNPLQADANRIAFADPEFLFRRETRGIRFQLEMLKPDLGQAEAGIESTVVVFGSARFVDPETAQQRLAEAEASGDAARIALAKRDVRNARHYDLAGKPQVLELIRECVEQINADLVHDSMVADSQIHRFLVLHKELDPDDDELTRTRKVRRNFVAEKYKVLIDALYAGKSNQYIETEVKFEDGRRGKVAADLKIVDAKTFPIVKKAA